MIPRLSWRMVQARMSKGDTSGIGLSVFAHAMLFAGLLMFSRNMSVALPETPPESILVEVATIDDVSRITEAPKPSMQAAPRETVLDGAEKPVESEAKPTPTDEGLPDPSAVPPPSSKGETSRLNTKKLADLLDKSVKEADRKPKKFDSLAKTLEKDLPQQSTLSPAEAATLTQYMQARITQCFSMPSGAENLDRMRVAVRIELTPEGKVVGIPEVTETAGQTAENSGFFRAFTESTKRAILRCQPYILPPAKFQFWQEQEIIFNPRDMVRQ
jgi:hypothetical protein